jgi:thiol-disulfide isomerase/thioredoxin
LEQKAPFHKRILHRTFVQFTVQPFLSSQSSSEEFLGVIDNNSTNPINMTSPEHSSHDTSNLFSNITSVVSKESIIPVSFGDVISLKDRPAVISPIDPTSFLASTGKANNSFTFGDVVPLKTSTGTPTASTMATAAVSKSSTISEERQIANQIRYRNMVVAVLSIVVAIGNFIYQYLHPIEPIQILFDLQQSSDDITIVGKNRKPTIIDFWAPWCENCKVSAATLQSIEKQYGNDVNFILINGDLPSSWPYIEALGVDAIPHMSIISYDGVVETSLIGPIPKHIIQEDIDVLLLNSRNNAEAIVNPTSTTVETNQDDKVDNNGDMSEQTNQIPQPQHIELPHKMLDVFAGKPDSARRVQF